MVIERTKGFNCEHLLKGLGKGSIYSALFDSNDENKTVSLSSHGSPKEELGRDKQSPGVFAISVAMMN